MRKEDKDIYEQIALKHRINMDLVQEVGDTVFAAWREWTLHPDNLRLRIDGLGTQIVRKKKISLEMDSIFDSKVDYINEENNTFKSEDDYLKYKQDQEWYLNIIVLRDIYKKYTAERAEIRKLRNAVQKPLTPTNLQPKEPEEPRQTYFDEH